MITYSYYDELHMCVLFELHQARREGEGNFPGSRDIWGAPPSLKNTEKGVPYGFFLTSNTH